MSTRTFFQRLGFACMLGGLLFLALAWRSEWIPRMVAQKQVPSPYGGFDDLLTIQVYRFTPVRSLRTLFVPYPTAARFYECRIRDRPLTITTFCFRFSDGFQPSHYSITLPTLDRASTKVVFSFGDGYYPLACEYTVGNTASWNWIH